MRAKHDQQVTTQLLRALEDALMRLLGLDGQHPALFIVGASAGFKIC
jgi:hypothetical protein